MPTALSPNSNRDGGSPKIDVSQFNSIADIINACGDNQRLAKLKCRAWHDIRLAKLDARENMKALLEHLDSDEFQSNLDSALESSGNRFSKKVFIDDLKNYLKDERLDSWERLAKSSPKVLESACMKIAALGLSPNHRLGYAWFFADSLCLWKELPYLPCQECEAWKWQLCPQIKSRKSIEELFASKIIMNLRRGQSIR